MRLLTTELLTTYIKQKSAKPNNKTALERATHSLCSFFLLCTLLGMQKYSGVQYEQYYIEIQGYCDVTALHVAYHALTNEVQS